MDQVAEHPSPYGFAQTLARLEAAIGAAGLAVFARIDHAANALAVGLAMPAATVLIYGAAKGGTPVMLQTPLAALDLPLRVLVQEAEGGVRIAFHPAGAMLRELGVSEALAGRLDPAQALLLKALTA